MGKRFVGIPEIYKVGERYDPIVIGIRDDFFTVNPEQFTYGDWKRIIRANDLGESSLYEENGNYSLYLINIHGDDRMTLKAELMTIASMQIA